MHATLPASIWHFNWARFRRPLRDALILGGLAYVIGAIVGWLPYGQLPGFQGPSGDVAAYWLANPSDPYQVSQFGEQYAYLYSPAFVQALAPVKLLPWELFRALWLVGQLAALWWLRSLWMIPVPFVYDDLIRGNVGIFYAVAIVLGFRYAGTWALMLLTKVTPAVPILWFAVRREWRALGIAVGTTVAIVALSALVAPDLWTQWVASLQSNATGKQPDWNMLPYPLALRVALAVGITGIGAWKGWRWTVPVASFLAVPSAWQSTGSVLAAIPRLRQNASRLSPPSDPVTRPR